MTGENIGPGVAWNLLEFIGLPKGADIESWSKYRWIGKAPSLQKSYLRMLIDQIKIHRKPGSPDINILGFRAGNSVSMVSGVLQELLYFGRAFPVNVAIASMDVETAFEQILHRAVEEAM